VSIDSQRIGGPSAGLAFTLGLLDELPEQIRDKKRKREKFAERALRDMQAWIEAYSVHAVPLARA
jgi:hypothetical protein